MGAQDNTPGRKPTTTPPSRTEPEDLHIPEKLPPPMPEEADKPEHPIGSNAVAGTNSPVTTDQTGSGSIAPQSTTTGPSETEAQDLHIPEKEPPPMPELADKPDAAQQKK